MQFSRFGSQCERSKDSYIHDIWLMRKLPAVVLPAGFQTLRFDGHGDIEAA